VLGHRIVFTPSFVAETRRTGWVAALEKFRGQCLEHAPRPESADRSVEGLADPL
jgi:hypothetical protein